MSVSVDPARGVVVGYDGSWHSAPAVELAAVEAVGRGTDLTLLTVVPATGDPRLTDRAQRAAETARWDEAHAVGTAAAAAVGRRHPGLTTSTHLVPDADTAALRQHLGQVRLLVLGSVGRRGSSAFLLGSTSRELVKAVRCPVLVVPETTPHPHDGNAPSPTTGEPGPGRGARAVVVGLAKGTEAVGLLRLAGAEAGRRGAPLCVVHAHPADEAPGRARAALDGLLAQAGLDGSLPVTGVITSEAPADALLRLARDAVLLVIGTRGPLALARLTLDSTSRPVLDAATGPVLLVPDAVSRAAAHPPAPGAAPGQHP